MQKIFPLSLVFIALTATAAPVAPREVVQTIIDKASKLDQKSTFAENSRAIESLIDFDRLTQDALGQHFAKISAAQKSQVRDLLKSIITKTVYPEAPKFFKNVDVQFASENENGNRVHVSSVIVKNDRRSTVEYWLQKTGNDLKVVDFAVEGERWVENVRDQFDEIIKKEGTNGLISKMKRRLTQIKSS